MTSRTNRTARVGELIRRVVAEELDDLDDARLHMVSITGVDVDRELSRAIVWYTALDDDNPAAAADAFARYAGRLRHAVGTQTRLRRAPKLIFRADDTLRSAQRIEDILSDQTVGDGEEPD